MKAIYGTVQWNGLTEEKVLELFADIPSPWSVAYPEAHHIVFSYNNQEMLDVTFGTNKVTYGEQHQTTTFTNDSDAVSFAFLSLHIAENAFAWRIGTSDYDLDKTDVFIFTKDNNGNPAIVNVKPKKAVVSPPAPAYFVYTAWNTVSDTTPVQRKENTYTNATETEMCPFVIDHFSNDLDTHYTPYACWIPVTSLTSDTGQLYSDYIPVRDSAGNVFYYNTYTALT